MDAYMKRLQTLADEIAVSGDTNGAKALAASAKAAHDQLKSAAEQLRANLSRREQAVRLQEQEISEQQAALDASRASDATLQGYGESTPFGSTYIAAHALGVRSGIAEIAPHLIGLDPRRVERINDAMDAALLGHDHAKTAIDVACWDVFGKSVGLPVCELLGGRTGCKMPIIDSIPVGSPEESRAKVAAYRAKEYLGHSIKVGDDSTLDAARVAGALRYQKPGEYFIVDANGGYTTETALRFVRLLPPNLDFVFEAPCATLRETLSLRRRTNIPIILDEVAIDAPSIIQAIADDAVEGIGLKISKLGGLTKCRRIRDICIAAGYTFSVQETAGSDIAFAAIVAMGQTVPERNLRCVLESREIVALKTADGDFDIVDGRVTAPTAPGLGITVRTEVLGAQSPPINEAEGSRTSSSTGGCRCIG